MDARLIRYVVLLTLALSSCQNEKHLPLLGNHPVADFHFLNQDSVVISNKTFDGKIYIANFFFTSCTTICPKMNAVVKGLYDEYQDTPDLRFLSHSIDFKYDTPGKLKQYAEKLGVTDGRWQFAHGSKSDVYTIAEQSYLSAVIEDAKVKENFVHQGYLLLVDKKRRLRGAYDSDSEEQVAKLRKDVKTLLRE